MLLKYGDSGEAVSALQRGLNKLGSILRTDGDFGPATRDAVADARIALRLPGTDQADDALQERLEAAPDPFPPLTAAGVTFIALEEVSGPREYRRKFKNPVWPGKDSGITIGIGYDLQFANSTRLSEDWGDCLSARSLALLSTVVGVVGSAERLTAVRDVEIGLRDAMRVFTMRTLSSTLEQTRSIYPQVDGLPPARRTALVSLVYNRGARLQDRDPAREERREVRNIARLLAGGDVESVSGEFDSMARLWDPDELPGLVQRRHDEATLWRSGFAALQVG